MSYCKVFAIGRLGKDIAEVRYTPNGKAVAEFSIATDRVSGENKHVEWLSLVVFGNTAEACSKHLVKGSNIFVEGYLKTDKWRDSLGIDRSKTKVIVERVKFLGAPKGDGTITSREREHDSEEREPGIDG